MQASALSMRRSIPTVIIELKRESRRTTLRREESQALPRYYGLPVGYPSAPRGTLRRILPQDSNDIVPWCNVALRMVREIVIDTTTLGRFAREVPR